jgi:Fe-S-cluster containining protein
MRGIPGADALEPAQARNSGASPQKPHPQKPKAEGPEFAFGDPAVLAAEASLREAAEALEASLQLPLQDPPTEACYRSLCAAVEAALPPFHARYDAWSAAVLATSPEKVHCAKGCGSCCAHYVSSVEPFELIRLHGRIREDAAYPSRLVGLHRRAALFNSLFRSLQDGRRDEEADDRALYRYYLRGLPCPFQKGNGECGVYEHRPMSCRMFYSLSHPSLCRGRASASPGNRNFILELPEDIEEILARASRRLGAYALSENLFEGLLEVNALFGAWDGAGERDAETPAEPPLLPSP